MNGIEAGATLAAAEPLPAHDFPSLAAEARVWPRVPEDAPMLRYALAFLVETNADPKPCSWTADPDKIIAAVRRGHQALDLVR